MRTSQGVAASPIDDRAADIGGQWCIRGGPAKGYDRRLMDEPPAPDEHLSRLMARAQQGDSDAYTTLLRAITPRIRQLVRGKRAFLGDSVVEDVVQGGSVHTVRATYDPA